MSAPTSHVRHFVDRHPDGRVARIIRVRDDGQRQWGEYFRDGAWHEDSSVLAVLWDGSLGRATDARGLASALDEVAG